MIQFAREQVAQARLAPHEGSKASANTTWCGAGTRLRYLLSNHTT